MGFTPRIFSLNLIATFSFFALTFTVLLFSTSASPSSSASSVFAFSFFPNRPLRAPATPPDSASGAAEYRIALEVAKWPLVSRRRVRLIVGSGDVKFARAAGISSSETSRAGLNSQPTPSIWI